MESVKHECRDETIANVLKPKDTKPASADINVQNDTNLLKVLSVNIRGIECSGRLDQIRHLLVKHSVSGAVLTETETTHEITETTNIDGFRSFCPPSCVTGPQGKEVGVTLMISDELSSSSKPRTDINGTQCGLY